jgi:ABC-type nitrate/sulfonate/bicarbonate transport system permease component
MVLIARTVPTAAVVLLLAGILSGYHGLPEYIPCFLVFLVVFPMIYEAFSRGIASESQDEKDALELDGGFRSCYAVVHVLWPDSQGYVVLSLVQALGLAMKVSVMSEILTGGSSRFGLGCLISYAKEYLDMQSLIAYSLVAVILISLIDLSVYFIKKAFANYNK